MNAKDRQAVEEAKKNKPPTTDNQQQHSPSGFASFDSTETAKTRTCSPKTPPNVSGGMNDALMQTAVSLKEGMKKVVVPAAFMMLMEDFANGDYGDTATDMMLQFQEGMLAPFEAQHQALLEGRVLMPQPRALLPSSGESTGSSSSIC
ncbi:MAG: hypothetical protein V7L26_11500 [Nostoc sp.]|uniref:hypothetical protein n=1 Tax=Nostoc sp. TaxID=1180 RepID=UPI002FF168E4